MTKPNKRARITSRLTNLHENELSHILSCLTTTEAVRTSILSKDWRYKWRSSYNVEIYDHLSDDPQPFVNFMNMILVSLQQFRRFRLECESNYLDHIQAWVDSALERRLESFKLQLDEDICILPYSLLNSSYLRKVKLDLWGTSTLNVGMNSFAPNLTCLKIGGVKIVNNHNTSPTLKFSFPVLKKFSVDRHSWLNVTSVEIDAPLLTAFCSDPYYEYDRPYSLVILSPKIMEFSCAVRIWEQIVVNGSSIVSANLRVGNWTKDSELPDIGLRFRKMVNEFTNLRTLVLPGSLCQVSLFIHQLPRHCMLRKLRISGRINVELLLKLLHKTPSLEVLKFHMLAGQSDWVDFDYGAIDSVPSCIVSHLEKVRIVGFMCGTPQYNLLNFFLKNGKKLKKLIMDSIRPTDKQSEVEEFVSTRGISGLVLQFLSCE